MNPPPSIVDRHGQPIPLRPELASGGEGAVFPLVNDPKSVAKVYHQPPTDQTAAKLGAMIGLANPRLLSMAAWPGRLVYHQRTRRLAGFVMPLVTDSRPIQHLYNPVQRLRSFPRKGWDFQVHAAANLAAAFDGVHRADCLVGDVNQSNVQVSETAMIRLIDCDSFQVRAGGSHFLCEVGVPLYTPPELQGQSFRGLVRTENHDRFGLAVLIYQLLFVGRHPYAGSYSGPDEPFEELIAKFRFSQGPLARSWGMAPPPYTPTLADIPPDLGTFFRRAFERGSESGTRPKPAEWLLALQALKSEIKVCKNDSGHKFWRGAGSCVWCRLAEQGGPEYYFGAGDGAGSFEVDEARLRTVVGRLEAARFVQLPYDGDRKQFAPRRPPRPVPPPEGLKDPRSITAILGVATALSLAAMPFGLWRGSVGMIGLCGAILFGVTYLVYLSESPWYRERRRRRIDHWRAQGVLQGLEIEWVELLSRYRRDHESLGESIRKRVDQCRELGSSYQVELGRLTSNAEAASRVRHLRLHLISDAEIPSIGAKRKRALAEHNIYTAADVDEQAVREIGGFGDALTGNLIAWRDDVLRRFRFDPATSISPAERQALSLRFRSRQDQLLAEVGQQIARLEASLPECHAAIQALRPKLKQAVARYEQTEVDLRFFE